MKNVLAGYIVIRNGVTRMHGSIRCELADDTQSSKDAACLWAMGCVKSRFNLGDSDDVRIMAFIDVPNLSAKAMVLP